MVESTHPTSPTWLEISDNSAGVTEISEIPVQRDHDCTSCIVYTQDGEHKCGTREARGDEDVVAPHFVCKEVGDKPSEEASGIDK